MDSKSYGAIILSWKWMIAAMIVAAMGMVMAGSWQSSVQYAATVHIIPVAPAWEDNYGDQIAPVLSSLSHPFRVLRLKLDESIYWELYSRTLADAVIEALDLQRYYRAKTMAEARLALEGHRHIQLTQEGTLQVSILDQSPTMAVAIANAHAEQLDRLDRAQVKQAALVRRQFFQKMADETFPKLAKVEEAWGLGSLVLKGITAVPSKVDEKDERDDKGAEESGSGQKGSIPMMRTAELIRQMTGLEVEMAALQRYAAPDHPKVLRLDARLGAIRKAIKQSQEGTPGKRPSIFPPLDRVPDLRLINTRLGREVQRQTLLYLHWRMMLEAVQIEVSLDMPRVWVLDWAIPEERPPQIWQTLLVAGELALFFGMLLAFGFSYLDRLPRPSTYSADEVVRSGL